ncbi:LysR family transcriptional regulator [Rhodobacteraceae bacterium F11138]|nr:LysR family transcriptional regulator [Rhodobacteraceae bacterium F11138]
MNQRQIQAFRQVMRHGSITVAAQALNVSQPAVSRLVAELERSLGFPLLVREGGKITPTAEAIEFEREVDHMYFGLERLAEIAREIKELRRASLYIATMPMVSFEILPRALKGFLSRHEGIRVTHNVHTSARIVDLVSSRQVELGITQTHGRRRDIDVVGSYRTYCVCVVTPDHPLARRALVTPNDLQDEKMVALAHHTLTANYVTRAFADANVRTDVTIESQPSYAACSLAAAGLGISIVDPMTVRVFGDVLVAIPFEPKIPFDFHLIKPGGVKLSRAAEAFAQNIIETLDSIPDTHFLSA